MYISWHFSDLIEIFNFKLNQKIKDHDKVNLKIVNKVIYGSLLIGITEEIQEEEKQGHTFKIFP